MGIRVITANSNQKIKELAKLMKSSQERKEQEAFVIEGRRMFEEAKAMGILRKTYVSAHFFSEIGDEESCFSGVDFEIVSDSVFKSVSDTKTPQGILAVAEKREFVPETLFRAAPGSFLFLEDIRDPGNLGTMVRTAEGAGAAGIILNRGCVDIYNPKVIRSTMGSVFRVPFACTDQFEETLSLAREKGIVLYAAHLLGERDYDREEYNISCGIIIGNEANGIKQRTAKLADHCVRIPMCGRLESLNAAVASSLILYEVYRQRRHRS